MTEAHLNHVGLTVADLDRSIKFYEDMFGFRFLQRGKADLPEVIEAIGVAVGVPGAQLEGALLAGDNFLLELTQFVEHAAAPIQSPVNGAGTVHICFPVDDLGETCRVLQEKGADFVAPPSPELNAVGSRFAYLRDPDGVILELLEKGLTIEKVRQSDS